MITASSVIRGPETWRVEREFAPTQFPRSSAWSRSALFQPLDWDRDLRTGRSPGALAGLSGLLSEHSPPTSPATNYVQLRLWMAASGPHREGGETREVCRRDGSPFGTPHNAWDPPLIRRGL